MNKIENNINRNVLTLAYIGDSIYDIYIREYLINKGIVKVGELQRESIKFVSAKAQANFLQEMLDHDILKKEELDLVYRARNNKQSRHPKNTDIITYKYATALESLFGYLYLERSYDRLNEIMNFILGR